MGAVENIKNLLSDFVNSGGNVNELKPGNRIYDYIKDSKLISKDGKRLTIDEKFIMAGFPRDVLYHLKKAVIDKANLYLKSGGSFHVERKSLPFYSELKSYVRALKQYSGRDDISYDEAMKGLGFNEYSTIYYKYAHLMDIKNYRDDEGFVDDYRKDSVMKSYIHQAAKQLNVPIAIVISLIGNENLKKNTLEVEFFEETKKMLLKELERGKISASFLGKLDADSVGLENLKNANLKLYNRLLYLKSRIGVDFNEDVTYDDVMMLIGFENKNVVDIKDAREKTFDLESVMRDLVSIARKQDNKLYRKDIPNEVYRKIVKQSLRHNCYTKDWFKMYDIDYVDGVNNERFKRFVVDEYPYMGRMRKDRDSIMKDFVKKNPDKVKEEYFEEYFKVCLDVYDRYKDKLYAFDIDEIIDEDEEYDL